MNDFLINDQSIQSSGLRRRRCRDVDVNVVSNTARILTGTVTDVTSDHSVVVVAVRGRGRGTSCQRSPDDFTFSDLSMLLHAPHAKITLLVRFCKLYLNICVFIIFTLSRPS